ncbi:MAG: DJ-1/PfpI family protein [Actinomycetota bacterium]|nr:DJ-1/PfpI family protein [Actinomycetota bacterium]MDQ5807883.1 DJ-1/PfpI family protein [Actinomycetota bacterium]
MKRVVVAVYDGVDMLDVCGPYDMFRWAGGIEVQLVAEVPGMVAFNQGFSFAVPDGLDAAKACDALWVPGGAPASLARLIGDPKRTYLDFLVAQADAIGAAGYVCSVCEGALLLAAAGLLDGHEATTHWAFIPYLLERHPAVEVAAGHPRFVLDGNRLTGGGISSGLDEALRLVELLCGTDTAQDVQRTTQYYPDPPVHSEIPNVITSPMDQVAEAPAPST